MQIVYHLGAHCTDEERLLRCLLKNRTALGAEGIVVPGPARYRALLRDTAMQLRGQTADRDSQALLLEQIMDEDRADRLVLSWDNFLGYPAVSLRERLYPLGAARLYAFSRIFPEIGCEFHLAIRNPATFVPALATKRKNQTLEEFLAMTDPFTLRWSDLLAAIREAVPGAPIIVWCDEDTPLLWPEVLRAVSGYAGEAPLEGEDEVLAAIMRPEGLERMNAYLAAHPPADALQRRRVAAAFLGKFARPEAVEVEFELPGWDEATVARLTENYDRDVTRIMRMEGVTFLAP